ncbi:MAG: bifunctional pyr operon transcriptional regulator/uracil phosphoribosyltransferase PyrR [Planctomycetes bacterium]|nr:bifunctional pyr operon transcriptional regulator/uracil phosphoribosyltransferase PyrR [Planctomycetota bacterium]
MKVILEAETIRSLLASLADQVLLDTDNPASLAVVGIRSRGEVLAERLTHLLAERSQAPIPCGTLDITLYRDDLNSPQGNEQPRVRTTEINFNVDDKTIILVDDVLFTGRSIRAALDALIDLGRPRAIRLAVLVERSGRELPIQPDYTCISTDVRPHQHVRVSLVESDGRDEVVVE